MLDNDRRTDGIVEGDGLTAGRGETASNRGILGDTWEEQDCVFFVGVSGELIHIICECGSSLCVAGDGCVVVRAGG